MWALAFDVFGTRVDLARSAGAGLRRPPRPESTRRIDLGDTHAFAHARRGHLLALRQIGTGGPQPKV